MRKNPDERLLKAQITIITNKIIDHLLEFSPDERKEIFSSIQYNEFFCVYCGFGSKEEPNTYCQCTNDE
jgi:hypothetical protein